MKKLRIVLDVDDTISTHKDRDYRNAIPHNEVIDKINHLHDIGYEVTLYTARGMVSCDGDLDKIIASNKEILEEWLERHNVKYDKLIFGKPLGDMYIDDKCMNVRDFVEQGFYNLKGGSNKRVIRIGNIVKKYATFEKIRLTQRWNEQSKGLCKTPNIISTLYESMYMDYIDGVLLSDIEDELVLGLLVYKVLSKVYDFKEIKFDNFDINKHISRLNQHVGSEIDKKREVCISLLKENEDVLKDNASFCHGDLILSNMILKGTEIYFIDPEQIEEASSYLLDLAKLRMSLSGYEKNFSFTRSKVDMKHILKSFDKALLSAGIYDIVVILHYMWVLRLWKYKDSDEKEIVLEMLRELEDENERIFKK